MSPSQQKASLRAQALQTIAAAPATTSESLAIQKRVLALPAFTRARRVSLFMALPGEPTSELLWEAAKDKIICCPGAGPDGPELRLVRVSTEMKRTARGFFEPPPGVAVDPWLVDLFVVPGLAFDAAGLRLGRGGGYYDRILARRRSDSATVGVLPERLLAKALPQEPHDVPMTLVATEARLLEPSKPSPPGGDSNMSAA